MKIKAEKDNKKMDSANKFLKKAAFRQFVSNSISWESCTAVNSSARNSYAKLISSLRFIILHKYRLLFSYCGSVLAFYIQCNPRDYEK
jgi:hypothetical protein